MIKIKNSSTEKNQSHHMNQKNHSLDNVPELRFPEFVEDGKYVPIKLGEVARFINGRAYKQEELLETGKYRVLRVGNFFTNNNWYYSDLELDADKYCEEGDLLYAWSASFGPRVWIGEKVIYHYHIWKVLPAESISKDFLYVLLDSETERMKTQNANGFALLHITKGTIENWECIIPTNKIEQQKIASCLSSLDELISAHSQKLELLKDHKKGLMQNLFPQEGETVPKYRFPEFENDGEWVEKKLGKVAIFLKGKGISKADIIEHGILPCIRYGELYTHYNEKINEIKSRTNVDSASLVLSHANDVIIPASGETQIDIATAACVLNAGVALGGDLNIIRTELNGVFLAYYLNNARKREIAQMAQGVSVMHLYPSQLKTLIIATPNLSEQQKIASSLSAVDELITAQGEKIEQLKLHKKGLMQGLFPKINN
jgi:type I restriction enzyme S subunit